MHRFTLLALCLFSNIAALFAQQTPANRAASEPIPLFIPPPKYKRLEGKLRFIHKAGSAIPFNRFPPASKNLEEEELPGDHPVSAEEMKSANVLEFYSSEYLKQDLKFQLQASGSADILVFAFYPEGEEVRFLYPFTGDTSGPCAELKKDLTEEELPPTTSNRRPALQTVVIPPPFCSDEVVKQRFMQLGGISKKETICVLFTRSTIKPEELRRSIKSFKGSLQDRLVNVLTHQHIAPLDEVEGRTYNEISFDATDSNRNVLPIIFHLYRE